MYLDCETKIGESTNLVAGYSADIYSVPFTNSSKPALYEKEAVITNPNDDAYWNPPDITLHENAEDLLSAVLQVKLRPMRNEDQPCEGGSPSSWPSGPLMLEGLDKTARQKAMKHLSTQLGIDLSTEGWSYALIRCTRKLGTANHLCYNTSLFRNPDPDNTILPDTLEALKKLEKLDEKSTDVSIDGAKGYLNFYETYGTHFVSNITAGDSIFQVFAYGASAFEELQRAYIDYPLTFSGILSYIFIPFTVPLSEDGRFGYTKAAGKICIASQDEALAKSLEDGLWDNKEYSGTNNVLAPYYYNHANQLNNLFKKVVPISYVLASISIFAEYYRMLIWHRVFKGVMYAKYLNGSGVAPFFSNNCPYHLDTIFKKSNPMAGDNFLSMLCTPSVNMMQETIDLSTIEIKFFEEVNKFSIFADAIQIPSIADLKETSINIPGSNNVTLLGHVISLAGNSPRPPNVQISDSAYQEIESRFFCGEFYGGLRIGNSDNSKSCVIMNGLMMKYSDGKVTIVCDVRESPSSKVVIERLADIQFALVVAEARLNFLLGDPKNNEKGIEFMKRFLLWLADVAGTEDQLVALKARATYLAKVAASPQGPGIPLPLLHYEAKKDVVKNVQDVLKTASSTLTNFQSQIRERIAEEREIDRKEALDENIIKSAELLYKYIKSQADYQESMESMSQSVFKDKEEEMNGIVEESKKLSSLLEEQRGVVDKAVIDYEDAVIESENNQILKSALDIAAGLFSVNFTFVIPSTSFLPLVNLGKKVQKIQQLVNVFNAVIEVYKNFQELPKNPQNVIDALKNVGLNGLEILSRLEWEELLVNHKAALDTGPAILAKTTLSAAFEILVLRGKALLDSQKAIQKIAADLSAVQQRIWLHQDQKIRLEELKLQLDAKPEELDVEKIDLIGLSGQLLFFQRQMLMILTSTVVIQERALQYEYLRQPTPVESFTMLGLQLAILRQSQSINQGLTVQPLPQRQKYPITYEIHGVRPETITNNRRFVFNIDINKREFAPFNYVRVESVVVEVDGIVSTDSGKYFTELVFHGQPFYDRGLDGETLSFQTTSRIFTGLQKVSSSSQDYQSEAAENPRAKECTTGQDAFDGKISYITPFSKWYFSLPDTPSNAGIEFGDRVNIRLIFRIYAQLMGTESSPLEIQIKSLEYLVRPPPVVAASTSSSSAEKVTNSDVLGMMENKSLCGGWDVVFSMTGEQVNVQLAAQYKDRQGNPLFMREIPEQINEGETDTGIPYKEVFAFKFNAPKLQFLLNNSNTADLTLPIISGYYMLNLMDDGKWTSIIDAEVKESDGAFVLGNVDLAILPGSVSSQKNVAVKLKGGSFSANKIIIQNLSKYINTALTDYFTKLKEGTEVYNFGTIDFTGISVLESLKPSNFLFNVYHTPSNRDLLQLFIVTTGEMQSSAQFNLKEPIPTDYECSLIINTKIFFQDVLPESFGNTYGLKLKSDEPADDFNKDKAWASEVTHGSVPSEFPRKMIREWFTFNWPHLVVRKHQNWIKVHNDTIVVDLEGMTFKYGDKHSSYETRMDFHTKKDYPFQFGKMVYYDIYHHPYWASILYIDYTLPVDVSIKSNLSFKVTGSGQNQMVKIDSSTANVHLEGELSPPAGTCESSDRELQKKFLEQVKEDLPPLLKNIFNKDFPSVSLFALKNLLFPAKNLFDLKEAFVPGDMVVFGNFTKPES